MPTRSLSLALSVEGRVDERFLPIIVRRTAEQILAPREIDVLEPIVLPRDLPKRAGAVRLILAAARQAEGFHALLVHTDADDLAWEEAQRQRIEPGFACVQSSSRGVCRNLVPVIPVRMVEAWMIADPEAVRQELGTDWPDDKLRLPPLHQVELHANPKEALDQAIYSVYEDRAARRRPSLADIQLGLANSIRLERLHHLDAYKRFYQDLTSTLHELQMLH